METQNLDSTANRPCHFLIVMPVVILTILIFATTANAQCIDCPLPSFAAPVSYPLSYLGQDQNKVEAGDFNNDGKLDLIVLSGAYSGVVTLFLNDGNGGFPSSILVPSPTPVAMATGDFNADGNLDLALGSYGDFWVQRGDGTGHFGDAIYSEQGVGYMGILDLATGDFNNDNKLDVFAKHGFENVLYLNDGQTLTPHTAPGQGFWQADGLIVADLNGDGNQDVLSGNPDIFFGDGAGNLTDSGANLFPTPIPLINERSFVNLFTVADYDGDHRLDIATPFVTVHLGVGAGLFATGMYYQNGTGHVFGNDTKVGWDVKSSDINGDGKVDLIIVGADKLSVLLGHGDGTFGSPTTFPGAASFTNQRMAVADFNGDGKPDVAALGADGGYPDPLVNFRLMIFLNSTYQTPVGSNSSVVVNSTSFTFDDVTTGGTTSVTPIDPASVGQVPGGFAVSDSVAYEITTSATFTGSVTLAFKVPGPISQADFNSLAILHNENGTLVDVTASTPARDYTNLTIYAKTSSFSPFYLARRGPHVKSLFDQTKAYKSGSTIPIKLQLLDANSANVSSSNTSIVTRDLRFISGNTAAPVTDAGNANPDYTFRYDATLGGAGGGYIFNLKTKGLASGQYALSFYAGSDHSFLYTVKFEVK